MWMGLKRYHADLVRRGAASEDAARYGEIQRIALPWLVPFVGMIVVAVVADLLAGPNAYWITICAVLLLGFPALLGMTYATSTYLLAGMRADRSKRRASLPKSPPSYARLLSAPGAQAAVGSRPIADMELGRKGRHMAVTLTLTVDQRTILERLKLPERIGAALLLPRVVLDANDGEIVSDALGDELAKVGFDADYELTPEGRLIEDLIDRLFIP